MSSWLGPAAGAGAAMGVVVAWAWFLRPAPRRERRLVAGQVGPVRLPGGGERGRRMGPGLLVGTALRRIARRPGDPAAARHLGRAVLVSIPVLFVSPVLVLAVAAWWWVSPSLTDRRRIRRQQAVVLAELPEVVDLFVLAVGAGLTVALAVPEVARHHRGVVGEALADAARRVALGARLADALATLPDQVGERARPLSSVLVSSERYGVALLPALERLAHDTRLERRRAAEAAARRVPVKLLFPLVLCTLPAFALLTVVPLLAGSLRSLRL